MGLVLGHLSEVNNSKAASCVIFFGFPVHGKFMVTLYDSALSVQQHYIFKNNVNTLILKYF